MSGAKNGYLLVAGYHRYDGDAISSYICPHPTRVVVDSLGDVRNWTMRLDELIEFESPNDNDAIETALKRRAAACNMHLWWIKPTYDIHNPHLVHNVSRALIEDRMSARNRFSTPALTDKDKQRLFRKGYQLLLGRKAGRLADLPDSEVLRKSLLPGNKHLPKFYR